MIKKVFIYGGLAFCVFFLAYRPGAAADVLKSLGQILTEMVRGFGEFIAGLVA